MPQRDDSDALRRMLRGIRASAQFPIVFGGAVSGGALHLTEFFGTTTDGLRRLAVRPGNGAGGQAISDRNLVAEAEYRHAPTISHDYDVPVLAEGIRSVMAAPIVVNGVSRMVAYVATRTPVSFGSRAREQFMSAAERLSRELEIRDEVDRRLALQAASADARDLRVIETAEEVSAELMELAGATDDESVRERLRVAAGRLTGEKPRSAAPAAALTPREAEVLALVSFGLSYPDVARSLALSPTTVKGYMQSTMAKLGARSRHEAVVAARLQRLLG